MKEGSVLGAQDDNSQQVQNYQQLELKISQNIARLEEYIKLPRPLVGKYKAWFCAAAEIFRCQFNLFFLSSQNPNDHLVQRIINEKSDIEYYIGNMYQTAIKEFYEPRDFQLLMNYLVYLQSIFPRVDFLAYREQIQPLSDGVAHEVHMQNPYVHLSQPYMSQMTPPMYYAQNQHNPPVFWSALQPQLKMQHSDWITRSTTAYVPTTTLDATNAPKIVQEEGTQEPVVQQVELEAVGAPTLQGAVPQPTPSAWLDEEEELISTAEKTQPQVVAATIGDKSEDAFTLAPQGSDSSPPDEEEEEMMPSPPQVEEVVKKKRSKRKPKKSVQQQEPQAKTVDPLSACLEAYNYTAWNQYIADKPSLSIDTIKIKLLAMCKNIPTDDSDTIVYASEFLGQANIHPLVLIDLLSAEDVALILKDVVLQRLMHADLNLELYRSLSKYRKGSNKFPNLLEIVKSNLHADREEEYKQLVESRYKDLDRWVEVRLESLVDKYSAQTPITAEDTEIAHALCDYQPGETELTLLMRLLQCRLDKFIIQNAKFLSNLIQQSNLSLRDAKGRTAIHHMLQLSSNSQDQKYIEFLNCMLKALASLRMDVQQHYLLPDFSGNTFLHTLVMHAANDEVCAESLDVIGRCLPHFYAQATAFVNSGQDTIFHVLDSKNTNFKLSIEVIYRWFVQSGVNRKRSQTLSGLVFVSGEDPILTHVQQGNLQRVLEILENRSPHYKSFASLVTDYQYGKTFLLDPKLFQSAEIGDVPLHTVLVDKLCLDGNEAVAELFQKSRAFRDLERGLPANDTLAYRMLLMAVKSDKQSSRAFDIYFQAVRSSINVKDSHGEFPMRTIWKLGDEVTPWVRYCVEVLKAKLYVTEHYSCNLEYLVNLILDASLTDSQCIDLVASCIKGGDRVDRLVLPQELGIPNSLFAATFHPNVALLRALLETHPCDKRRLTAILQEKYSYYGRDYTLLEFIDFKLGSAIEDSVEDSEYSQNPSLLNEDDTIDELQKMYHYVRALMAKLKILPRATSVSQSSQVALDKKQSPLQVYLHFLESAKLDIWNSEIQRHSEFGDISKEIHIVLVKKVRTFETLSTKKKFELCNFFEKASIPIACLLTLMKCQDISRVHRLSFFKNFLTNSSIRDLYVAKDGKPLLRILTAYILDTPEVRKKCQEEYEVLARVCVNSDKEISLWMEERFVEIVLYMSNLVDDVDLTMAETMCNYQRIADKITLLMVCMQSLTPESLELLNPLIAKLINSANFLLKDAQGRTAFQHLLANYHENYLVILTIMLGRIVDSTPEVKDEYLKPDVRGETILHTLLRNPPPDNVTASLLSLLSQRLPSYMQHMTVTLNVQSESVFHILEQSREPYAATYEELFKLFRAYFDIPGAKQLVKPILGKIMAHNPEPLVAAVTNDELPRVLYMLENRYVVRHVAAVCMLGDKEAVIKTLILHHSRDLLDHEINGVRLHRCLMVKLLDPKNQSIAIDYLDLDAFTIYESLAPLDSLALNAVLYLASQQEQKQNFVWEDHSYARAVENLKKIITMPAVSITQILDYANELGGSSALQFLQDHCSISLEGTPYCQSASSAGLKLQKL